MTVDPGSDSGPIIETHAVSAEYRLPRAGLIGPRPTLMALTDAHLRIWPGMALGIVGESGSGKSTLTRILAGDLKPTSGSVEFEGSDLWASGRIRTTEFRRSVQLVLQNPRSSFDPRMKIGQSLREPLRALRVTGDHGSRIEGVLEKVGLRNDVLDRYPHEFSGGQLQRIAIARALLPEPRVLIADEPVSALDVSIQAQVLNLLRDLVDDLGLALVLVAHDLSVVAYTTDHVVVLGDGRIVEQGPPRKLFTRPEADETRALVDAILTVAGGLEGTSLHQ